MLLILKCYWFSNVIDSHLSNIINIIMLRRAKKLSISKTHFQEKWKKQAMY